jgi:sulfate adenylyltransferase
LRSANNDVIAIMTLDEVYHWDADTEAALAYGSTDPRHPMVSEMERWGKVCISGPIKVINPPKYYDFVELRRTPAQVREMLEEMGNENVVAFQTQSTPHSRRTDHAAAKRGSLIIRSSGGQTGPVTRITARALFKGTGETAAIRTVQRSALAARHAYGRKEARLCNVAAIT